MKKAYYYLYYKLYKWIGEDNWQGDWKSELTLDVLFYLVILSGLVYYKIYIDRYFQLGSEKLMVFLLILLISLPNYFIFHHRDQWKNIVKEYDKLPKEKNKLGGWLVFGLVMMIIGNIIFAFYQMSLIDWTQYR